MVFLSVCFLFVSAGKSKHALIVGHLIRIHARKWDLSVRVAHLHRFSLVQWVRKSPSNSSDKTNPSDSLISEHNTWDKRTVSGTKRMRQKDELLGFRVDIWPWGRYDRESTVGHFSRFRFQCNSLKARRQLIRAIEEASGGCISYRSDWAQHYLNASPFKTRLSFTVQLSH